MLKLQGQKMARKTLNAQIEKEVSKELSASVVLEKTVTTKSAINKPNSRWKNFTIDLRIHSPASLGYFGIEGIDAAPAIVRLAKVKRVDVIALTDYYSTNFIDRVMEAARETSVCVIPGTDIRCKLGACDDTILTCLFPQSFNGQEVKQVLQELNVPESAAGDKNYLVKMPFDRILSIVEGKGGIIIPSRMDRTPLRLGAIKTLVEDYGFRAFDLAYSDSATFFKTRWPKIKFKLLNFSNANSLAQIGSRTARIKMPEASFAAIKQHVARETNI